MSDFLFTSESVSEGHPDKVADAISDAVLDAVLAQDKNGRVAAETLVATGLVVMAGQITTHANLNYSDLARDVIKRIGYDDSSIGFDYRSCAVLTAFDRQSQDIKQGVDEGSGLDLEQGAGDQGLMYGFACDETPQLMPMPIYYAHRLMERQAELRRDGRLPWLRPDAKSQVSVRYVDSKPHHIDTVVISTQHREDISHEPLTEAVIEEIVKPVLPKELCSQGDKVPDQPHRPLRDRRPAGRHRPHRTQDHRRQLRRLFAPRRRRVLRQGSVESRPLGRLRGALRREEHRRRGAREEVRGAGRLRDRHRASGKRAGRDFRHRAASPTKRSRSSSRNTSTCGRKASSIRSTCCGRSMARPRHTATSAATSRNSRGRRRTKCRRSGTRPAR